MQDRLLSRYMDAGLSLFLEFQSNSVAQVKLTAQNNGIIAQITALIKSHNIEMLPVKYFPQSIIFFNNMTECLVILIHNLTTTAGAGVLMSINVVFCPQRPHTFLIFPLSPGVVVS